MPETSPQYDYDRYFKQIFQPYENTTKIENFLHKIRDFILVADFHPVGDEENNDCCLLFKGHTVADLRSAFRFPSTVFFDLKNSQIINGLQYNSRPVRVIKPENCHLSIEEYLNRNAALKNESTLHTPDKEPYNTSTGDDIQVFMTDKNFPKTKSAIKNKIITNRQLNFTLSPVDTYNYKEIPYKLNSYEIDGTWNHHQSIILDVILDRIFEIAYQQFKRPPRSWRSGKTIETVEKFSGGTVNPASISHMNSLPNEAHSQKIQHFYADYLISLNPIKLFETYPVLKPYRYTLTEQLKKIAQTKFKMTYKVKYMHQKPTFDKKGKLTDSGQLIDLNYRMNEFQQLFEISVAGKDEIILNFKSPLGKLIIHNTLILDTDWCPVEAMSLKKNAYFLYKRFILNKLAGKHKSKTLELKFDDLKGFLDLKWSNPSGVHTIIKSAFDSMVQKKLLAEYKAEKRYSNERRYILYFENEAKERKERKKEDKKILKFKAHG